MNSKTVKSDEAGAKGGQSGTPPAGDRDFWEGRASEFSEHAVSTGYAEGFMECMGARDDWTVLDMGCGGGTLAIPLARKVKSVTAVDFSKNMLDILRWSCRNEGIDNVSVVQGRWEDDWKALGIGLHDVAIASRSIIGRDIGASITKLSSAATQRVYISAAVGDGPFDRRVLEAAGRTTVDTGADYRHIFHEVLRKQMGIEANIAFVREKHTNEWGSIEEAVDGQRWMFRGFTGDEEEKVRAYLGACLVEEEGRWRLPYKRQCEWAVMWWSK